MALRITDGNGATAIATIGVLITNAPPTAAFSAGAVVKPGASGVVSFSHATDPSTADVAAGFKYSYDFNNDGVFEITDTTSATATVPATYLATVGNHTIHGRIKDKDGGFTDYTTTISVTAPILASISGTVYADNNGNGKKDAAESGVSGRKLYIDKNKNGVLDAGEPTVTTGTSGSFSFTGLTAGSYRLRDVMPAGWRRTNPSSGYYDVVVAAGPAVTARDFAETTNGSISGVVFKDANSNGKQDAGEVSATTDSKGNYSFIVSAGKYNVREVLKSGFTRTTPASGVYAVTVAASQVISGKLFGNK